MTEKTEQKKKTKGCLIWWAIIFVAIIILGVIGGNLNDQEAQQKANEPAPTTEQTTTPTQTVQEWACTEIMASKISYIYDYTECAQTASKITEDSMLIHAFTQCATTFINDYYDNTVKDYSNCTGAELLGIKKMDQYYTTYTNCIGGVKTDYTVDMAGAFAEVTQCHADFITSFNSMF